MKFLDRLSRNAETLDFMKISPVGAEPFLADRRTDKKTDMTKLIVAFRNFADAPKIAPTKLSSYF